MDDPRELLVEIAKRLDKLLIPYMITGGMAVFVWGRPRFTADIDIVIELPRQKLSRLADELRTVEEAGYIDKRAMLDALNRQGEFNFIAPSFGLKVDFWIIGHDAYDHARLARVAKKDILGYLVAFISSEDLIISKLRWINEGGGDKHVEDIRSIFAVSGKKLNHKYLRQEAVKQGLWELLQECSHAH